MATSSIHDTCVIKDEKALDNLEKAFANPREFPKAKPVTESEQKKTLEIAKKWMYSHSGK